MDKHDSKYMDDYHRHSLGIEQLLTLDYQSLMTLPPLLFLRVGVFCNFFKAARLTYYHWGFYAWV